MPEGWEMVRLGDVCSQRRETIQPSGKGDYNFVGLEHVKSGETKLQKYVSDIDIKSSKFRFYSGDVLYGKLRPYLDKAVIADLDGICSTDLLVLSPDENATLAEFLIYLIHSKRFIQIAMATTSGTNHPRTSWKELSKFNFPLPPLPEQRKIASILSTVDDAIQKVGEAIAKTERLKQGLMQELLTKGIGHERFKDSEVGRIPEKWEVVRLEDESVTDLIMGQSPPSSTYNKNKIGLPFLQGNAEFGDTYPTHVLSCSQPVKIVEKNDILLSVRAPVGDVNIAPFKSCIGRGLAAIRSKSDRLNYLFLFYYLRFRSRTFQSLSMGSTFKAIRKGEIEKFNVSLPPLPEQQKIASILSTVGKKLELENKRKETLERIKRSLMNDLLTGEKRVKLEVAR